MVIIYCFVLLSCISLPATICLSMLPCWESILILDSLFCPINLFFFFFSFFSFCVSFRIASVSFLLWFVIRCYSHLIYSSSLQVWFGCFLYLPHVSFTCAYFPLPSWIYEIYVQLNELVIPLSVNLGIQLCWIYTEEGNCWAIREFSCLVALNSLCLVGMVQ